MREKETSRPSDQVNEPSVSERSDSEKWLQMVFGFHEPLLNVLSDLQPLVVLFSVSIVVATFTRQVFPEASDWALVAAFGFGWALVFSAAMKFMKSDERGGRMAIPYLYIYFGVLLGFVSLGLALLFMLSGNDLIIRAGLFMGSEAVSLGSFPMAFRTRSWADTAGKLAKRRGESGLKWSILGKANAAGMLLATVAPPLLFFRTAEWIPGWVVVAWIIGLGIEASSRAIIWLAPRP